MEERRQKEARHKKTEIQMAKLFTSEEEKGTIFIILFILFCHNLSFVCLFIISLLHAADEHRKKDSERRKNSSEKAKLFMTEEEKGILCTLFFFFPFGLPVIFLLYAHSSGTPIERRTS